MTTMTHIFSTRVLVQGNHRQTVEDDDGNDNVDIDIADRKTNDGGDGVYPLLISNIPLSFWGGIDEKTGIIIDTSHPLHGRNVQNTILCLPSGRGSCTASQVLLELILNNKAPRALVLRDRDGLVCVGALIAQSIFPESKVLDVLQILPTDSRVRVGDTAASTPSTSGFEWLVTSQPQVGSILSDGRLIVGPSRADLEQTLRTAVTAVDDEPSKLTTDRGAFQFTLTSEEQGMIESATTDAERCAIDCLIRYAHIVMDEPSYVQVEKAHIDGCTYIGPGGLHFVERLVHDGGRVKVPTSLNSVSTDLRNWYQLGIIPTESQQNSIALANAYLQLGCSEDSFTCAPYLLDQPPQLNQQIVWGESNAVVYANSILGARTEKYADYLDICCAMVGKVPAVGVHLDDYRKPTIVLEMTGLDLECDDPHSFSLLFPVLGHLCGTLSDGEVPVLVGLQKYAHSITKDHLKAFCAAFGTTAASPLIHIAGITPEAMSPSTIAEMIECSSNRRQTITAEALDETFRLLDQQENTTKTVAGKGEDDEDSHNSIEWVALGNPHLSLTECDELLRLLEHDVPEGMRKHKDVSVMACISRALYDKSPSVPKLEAFGVTFVRDTCWCMLLDPPMIPTDPEATILTNSGKYAHYGPGLTGRNFRLGSMKDCVYASWNASLPRRPINHELPWRGRINTSYRSFCTTTTTKTTVEVFSGNNRTMRTIVNRVTMLNNTPSVWYQTTFRLASHFL